ncbi:Nudix hydrolase 23 [Chlorella vulgaris]
MLRRPLLLPLPSAATTCLHAVAGSRSQQSLQPMTRSAAAAAAAAAGDSDGGVVPLPPKPRQTFSFCRMCGGPIELAMPEGDTLWRHVCQKCSFVDYQNPRLVVGVIVLHDGKVLLCRRGIEPQRGLWTVPAGYLECGESSAEGAARECLEEAGAHVEIDGPFCHYDIPAISQAYLLFRGRLAAPFTFAAQLPESLEARLFAPDQIPFDQLAFSSVSIALKSYLQDLSSGRTTVHHGVIQKAPGSSPNDPGSFRLVDSFELCGDVGVANGSAGS